MKIFRATTILLSLALLAAQPVAASIISDGSSGMFRPTSDFTLDLSGPILPQYSSVYIDAGIRLTVLTPTGGAFGDLLAANDIFINGIVDAGSGNLGLLAGNQISLGLGSQLSAGSLTIAASSIINSGAISVLGGTINVGTTPGTLVFPDLNSGAITIGAGLSIGNPVLGGGVINLIGGGSVQLGGSVQPTFPPVQGYPGTIIVGDGGVSGVIGGIALATVPEPSTLLLLLPGLALLARPSRRHEHA